MRLSKFKIMGIGIVPALIVLAIGIFFGDEIKSKIPFLQKMDDTLNFTKKS